MNQQLSIFDYLDKPKNRQIRQDLLVSILTPAGVNQERLPATLWLKNRNRQDFNPKKLLHDGAGHTYVVQKIYKRKQDFSQAPIQLNSDQQSLVDYLKPTVELIMNQLNQEPNRRKHYAK